MRSRVVLRALPVVVPIAVVAAVWLATRSTASLYFPTPDVVASSFSELWVFERVSSDVVPSLRRALTGYALACAGGVLLGLALGANRLLREATAPLVSFLRVMPPPALLPFAIVVLGVGDAMKVFIIAFVCLWPVVLSTVEGVRGVDGVLRDTASVFRLGAAQRLWRVVVPGAAPRVLAGMRTSLALALIMMVVSELVASTNGLGFFILQSQRTFAIPEMWSGIVLLGLLGFTLNAVFTLVERLILRNHGFAETRS